MLQREGIPTQPRFTENRIAVSCLQFNQSSESGESGSSPGDFAPGGSSSLSPCSFMACLLQMTGQVITCSCCNLLTCLNVFHPFLSTVTNTEFSYKYRLYIYTSYPYGQLVLRQDITMSPWLALNPQFSCLSLSYTRITSIQPTPNPTTCYLFFSFATIRIFCCCLG